MAEVTKLCCVLFHVVFAWTICIDRTFAVNNRPVIGVLSQASRSSPGQSYILSSYIKYLEEGGARVVPIRIFEPETYYIQLFKSINGVLLPGGGADTITSGYAQAARLLYKLAIEANDAGDYFPMWGICLGFEQLSVLVAGKNILSNFDAEDLNLPLNFTYPGFLHGRMFHEATAEIIGILKNQNVTANAHHEGVSPEVFFRNGKLKSFFRILSTNRDRQGKQFISSFEGFKYPIYGTQFHPEKNTFIWSKKYPWMHSKDAIKVTQYFTNFFVNEARRSNHAFMSEELAASAVIENYKPVYLKDTYPFESSYYFNFTRNVFQVIV